MFAGLALRPGENDAENGKGDDDGGKDDDRFGGHVRLLVMTLASSGAFSPAALI